MGEHAEYFLDESVGTHWPDDYERGAVDAPLQSLADTIPHLGVASVNGDNLILGPEEYREVLEFESIERNHMPRATKTRTRRKTTKKSATNDIDSVIDDLYLPEGETIEPSDSLLDYCILIYGESAIGKTSTVSKIPGVYMIQIDPKRKNLSIRQSNIPNMSLEELNKERPKFTPWQILSAMIDKLCADPTVKTIALDNFGLLYQHALRHKCYKRTIKDPSEENDYGQTWREIEDDMTTVLNKILAAGKGFVAIAHDTSREIETVEGTFERIQPEMMKAAFKWIKACTDFAFYMSFADDGSRVLHLRSDKEIWTKCCTDEDLPRFMDPQGKPLMQISCGSSPSQAWMNLNLAWENKLQDVSYKPKGSKRSTKGKSRSRRKVVKD
jgi:phage nucleotide-binding protein